MISILFVDDEPEFVRPQIRALEEMGYDVTLKTDPDSAIALLQSKSFDLILLDLIMPPYEEDDSETEALLLETGEKIHKEIRDDIGIDTPIIFLTVIRDQSIRNGISQLERRYGHKPRFLTKPISSSLVIEEVEKVLAEAGK